MPKGTKSMLIGPLYTEEGANNLGGEKVDWGTGVKSFPDPLGLNQVMKKGKK